MQVSLDVAEMTIKEEAHKYLSRMLQFPDYYGNNLDALYDCLTEAEDLEIRFTNYPEDEGYFPAIRNVFLDASFENPGLRIVENEAPCEAGNDDL